MRTVVRRGTSLFYTEGDKIMFKFINSISQIVRRNQRTLVITIAVFVLLGGSDLSQTAFGQKVREPEAQPSPLPPPINAIIVNTPAQSVPVTGTVNVGNLGASPLPVTGTVNVGNLGDNPLPVRDVDNPVRQPVQFTGQCSQTGRLFCLMFSYQVPAGKRLVIEYVSISANAPAGQVVAWGISTNVGGRQVAHFLPNTSPAAEFFEPFAQMGVPVQLYADPDPDNPVLMIAARNGEGASVTFRGSFSGYLVNVP
jgi:hypothetical protein